MVPEMTSKLLNKVFEQTYILMESILDNPEHCDMTANGEYNNFMRAIEFFTANIRVEDTWTMNEDEEDDNNYFETGYHDSSVVFYPFSENQEHEKDDIIYETKK